MARIQTLTPQADGLSQRPIVQGDVQQAVRGSQNRKKAMELLADFSSTLIDRRQDKEDNVFLTSQTTEADLLYAKNWQEFTEKRINTPEGAGDEFVQSVQDDIQKRVDGARNPEIGRKLNDLMQSRLIKYGTQAYGWENNRRVQKLAGTIDNQIAGLMEQSKRSGGDMQALAKITQQMGFALGSANGILPDEVLSKKNRTYKTEVYAHGLDSLIATSPQAALEQLERGDWDEVLNDVIIDKGKRSAKARLEKQSALQLQHARGLMRDALALAEATGRRDMAVYNEIAQTTSPEEFAKFQEAEALATLGHEEKRKIEQMTPKRRVEYMGKLADQLENSDAEGFADKAAQYGEIQKHFQAITKLQAEDPAGYAVSVDSELASNPKALIEWQEAMNPVGVRPGVLGKAVGQQMAAEFNALETTSEKQMFLEGLRVQYQPEHMHAVINDLERGGMNKHYLMALALNPVTHNQQYTAMIAGLENKASDYPMLDPADRKDIGEQVGEYLNEFARTHMSRDMSAKEMAPMFHAYTMGALELAARGMDPSDAAEFMTEALTGQYEYEQVEDHPLRIPEQLPDGRLVDQGRVSTLAEVKRREIADNVLISNKDINRMFKGDVPDDQGLIREAIMQRTMWMNDPNDERLVLVHRDGSPVRTSDEEPIYYPFDNNDPFLKGKTKLVLDEEWLERNPQYGTGLMGDTLPPEAYKRVPINGGGNGRD